MVDDSRIRYCVICELTVAVRITSMSVVTVDEDGNGDVLIDGRIDS